jgi:thiamine pyrophosphate-dependent acetolactate synthase large subunit-like protein
MYTPGIAIVFEDEDVAKSAADACLLILSGSDNNSVRLIGEESCALKPPEPLKGYIFDIFNRASLAISKIKKGVELTVICGKTLGEIVETAKNNNVSSVDMVITFTKEGVQCDSDIERFFVDLEKSGIHCLKTSLSTVIYRFEKESSAQVVCGREDVIEQNMTHDRMAFMAQTMANVTEYLIKNFCNPVLARRIRSSDAQGAVLKTPANYGHIQVTVANILTNRLDLESKEDWGFGYFTGSVVAPFIQFVTNKYKDKPKQMINGVNEHQLACGALARWQLSESPFLISVTCGMMLEFKGTLMNLKRSKAKGFIVCGEGDPNTWYAAQGMMNNDEDILGILEAMGIRTVYLDSIDSIEVKLQKAIRYYNESDGPVVILATPRCYDSSRTVFVNNFEGMQVKSAPNPIEKDVMDPIVDIINNQKKRVLWVVDSPLDKAENAYLEKICSASGIVLSDSIQRPGAVSEYNDKGVRNPHYIGTLGVYGTSPKVYQYLFKNGRIASKDEQVVFFIKSKMGQPSSPFGSGIFAGKLISIQVNKEEGHLAPYASIKVNSKFIDFAKALFARLDVSNDVLLHRRLEKEKINNVTAGPLSLLPTSPVSPNYFFHKLGCTLSSMIETEGYTYRGVFDAGRCAFSAVRNLPRTQVGFSSVYGRGNMGDAMMSLPSIAIKNNGNTLAFIGDGAKNVVPDIIPALLKNIRVEQSLGGNLTVFIFVNKTMSMIRSYMESGLLSQSGVQMHNHQLLPTDMHFSHYGVDFNMETISEWDEARVRDMLSKKSTVNIIHVMTAHNSSGDIYEHLDDSWHKKIDGDT